MPFAAPVEYQLGTHVYLVMGRTRTDSESRDDLVGWRPFRLSGERHRRG